MQLMVGVLPIPYGKEYSGHFLTVRPTYLTVSNEHDLLVLTLKMVCVPAGGGEVESVKVDEVGKRRKGKRMQREGERKKVEKEKRHTDKFLT